MAKRRLDFDAPRAPSATKDDHGEWQAVLSTVYYFFLRTPSYYLCFHETSDTKRAFLPACQLQLLPPTHECLTMARWLASTAADYAADKLANPRVLPEDSRLRREALAVKRYAGSGGELTTIMDQTIVNQCNTATTMNHTPALCATVHEISHYAVGVRARLDAFNDSFLDDSPLRKPLPWQEPWTLFVGERSSNNGKLQEAVLLSRDAIKRHPVPVSFLATWHPNAAIDTPSRYMPSNVVWLVVLHYAPGQGRIYGHHVDEIDTVNHQSSMGACDIVLQPGLEVRFLYEETLDDMVSIPHDALSNRATAPRTIAVYHAAVYGKDAE